METMANLLDPSLETLLAKDKANLELTKLPIVTVSASYKEDVKGMFGYPEDETIQDVVLSRAHYSMALGIAMQAWGDKVDPEKAWLVDPTNYVSHKDWARIEFAEAIGKLLARQPFLKHIKDVIDNFGRSKLPILKSITPPLLHLTEHVKRPILCFHIAAGNILAEQGKTIIQVITDPHVRDEYLNNAHRETVTFCVFNDNTKTEFLEKAAILGIKADPNRVIVTGPPIDPRIIASRPKKKPWRSGPLKICLTTGGLGTNKVEMRTVLRHLLPELRRRPSPFQLLIYAATHPDIYKMIQELAAENHIPIEPLADKDAKFRVIYHPQIVDANEMLIKYGFGWADGFITKPSGDMAYDAAISGSFVLSLAEWGEWEHNIRQIFEQLSIARKADADHIVEQLHALTNTDGHAQSWVEQAMLRAQSIDKQFINGAKEIIKVAQR
jgi:hypothetical protein